jgi:1-acyl-sn-glycerol-3-phosphate acyltransferase
MNGFYYFSITAVKFLSRILLRPVIDGEEHVPREGGFILAVNHVSYFDPPFVGSFSPREMFFLAKEELFRNRAFGWLIWQHNARPIKRGAVDRQAIKTGLDAIARGYGLILFPEGTRSLTDQFLPPKAGLGMLAHKAKCPIVPMYLHGSNKLSDCIWGRDQFALSFGQPLSAEWISSLPADREGYDLIATTVMDRISSLRDQFLAKRNH